MAIKKLNFRRGAALSFSKCFVGDPNFGFTIRIPEDKFGTGSDQIDRSKVKYTRFAFRIVIKSGSTIKYQDTNFSYMAITRAPQKEEVFKGVFPFGDSLTAYQRQLEEKDQVYLESKVYLLQEIHASPALSSANGAEIDFGQVLVQEVQSSRRVEVVHIGRSSIYADPMHQGNLFNATDPPSGTIPHLEMKMLFVMPKGISLEIDTETVSNYKTMVDNYSGLQIDLIEADIHENQLAQSRFQAYLPLQKGASSYSEMMPFMFHASQQAIISKPAIHISLQGSQPQSWSAAVNSESIITENLPGQGFSYRYPEKEIPSNDLGSNFSTDFWVYSFIPSLINFKGGIHVCQVGDLYEIHFNQVNVGANKMGDWVYPEWTVPFISFPSNNEHFYQVETQPRMVEFTSKPPTQVYTCLSYKQHIYLSRSDFGNTWSQPVNPFGNWQTLANPDIAEFEGKLYIAFTGLNKKIYVSSSSDGVTWSTPFTPFTWQTNHAPSLFVFDTELYIGIAGLNTKLYLNKSSDGSSWSNWMQITQTDEEITSNTLPQFRVFNHSIFLTYIAKDDQKVYTMESANGHYWEAPRPMFGGKILENPNSAPTMVAFNDKLYMAALSDKGYLYISTIQQLS